MVTRTVSNDGNNIEIKLERDGGEVLIFYFRSDTGLLEIDHSHPNREPGHYLLDRCESLWAISGANARLSWSREGAVLELTDRNCIIELSRNELDWVVMWLWDFIRHAYKGDGPSRIPKVLTTLFLKVHTESTGMLYLGLPDEEVWLDGRPEKRSNGDNPVFTTKGIVTGITIGSIRPAVLPAGLPKWCPVRYGCARYFRLFPLPHDGLLHEVSAGDVMQKGSMNLVQIKPAEGVTFEVWEERKNVLIPIEAGLLCCPARSPIDSKSLYLFLYTRPHGRITQRYFLLKLEEMFGSDW